MLPTLTKLKKFGLLTIAALILAASCPYINAQSNSTPEGRVRAFYGWYFKSITEGKEPSKDVIKSHLSGRFSRSYFSKAGQDSDYDAFLNSQEWSQDWADNMNVGKATIKGNTAAVRVKLSITDDDFVLTLRISLVKENGTWKIDRVTSQGSRATR